MAATASRQTAPKGANKRNGPSSRAGSSSSKKRSSKPTPKPVQQKTKSVTTPARKKKRTYTEKELGIPELNGIRPTGVQKPPNAKKGKNFVDDKESMNAILAMVMAEKDGNIESKMMRARQMEEIRQAKRAEAEKRVEGKKRGLEERKQEIKESKKKGSRSDVQSDSRTGGEESVKKKNPKKRVSFG